jgi:hypothetical protein
MFIIVCVGLSGCEGSPPSAEKKQQILTDQSMQEANSQIGMPAIKNFQERKLAKFIFELRDKENLKTYAYIVNHMTGKLVFIGRCIGYGLPYSVQYTNPQKIDKIYGGSAILPQADPNGLYMPQGMSATWLLMIDPKTEKSRPVYIEPEIVVSPFKLR